MVYQPDLEAMIKVRIEKQCLFRVVDAGFGADKSVNILVRAHFSTALDVDETEEDVPPAKRCGNADETWSFNFSTGEIRQVANTQPLQIVKNHVPNQCRTMNKRVSGRYRREELLLIDALHGCRYLIRLG